MASSSTADDIAAHIRGATWPGLVVTFEIDDVAQDITGAAILMQLRATPDAAAAALEFSTAAGDITLSDPTNGVFTVEPAVVDIAPATYSWDFRVTLASGAVYYSPVAEWEICANVSRD